MNEQNPYASPNTSAEDLENQAELPPESLRQASWQGLKLGFKWGNRAGLIVSGLVLLLLVLVGRATYWWVHDGVSPDRAFGRMLAPMLIVVWIYAIICGMSSIAGVCVASAVHVLRRIGRFVMRR
jgi:hypothetical protein